MARRQDVQSADGVIASMSPAATLLVHGGAPTAGASGFAKAAIWIDRINGLVYTNTGTTTSATWTLMGGGAAANAVIGVAAGYKLARGAAALGGANPTAVATGLTTIVSGWAGLNVTAAPGVSTSVLTTDIQGTTLNVYAWKPTSNANPTLIASTGTDNFYWIAVGT
jgi:hypothetical protein